MKGVTVLPLRTIGFFTALGLVAVAPGQSAASVLTISPAERNWEFQVGQQAYVNYLQRGQIVSRQSRLYGILDPIANAIAKVANRQYYTPFQFILLNEQEPNAVAMPGGKVYVTTAMLSYVRTKDELAGVICHEVNHDIHHDMFTIYQAEQRGVQPIGYERAAETQADRSGAYTCAKAGFNPWGMVWNMRLHRGMGEAQPMGGVSDHPSDDQRIADLSALLTSDRSTFGKYRDDVAAAAPLSNARVFARSPYEDAGSHPWYPSQYPYQYPSQYQQPYPSQYPQQYSPQYPYQYPSQYPPQSPPQMAPYPPPPPPPPCYPQC